MKRFEGNLYVFDHLAPSEHWIALNAANTISTKLYVTYSCHCFTEAFDANKHLDHHRYTYANEIRAFNLVRFKCSLHLPMIISKLARAKVYRALQNNYTYVAQVPLEDQKHPYSIFFSLKNVPTASVLTVRMYVQSAYIKPLTIGAYAQNWRFGSLLGQLTGTLTPSAKRTQPKKKAPKRQFST